jgi:hypothetical protein
MSAAGLQPHLFNDIGNAIAVDTGGNAYVTGQTFGNFPTTVGALNRSLSGSSDAFVAELNPKGSELVYSTYLGGSGNDFANGIVFDLAGDLELLCPLGGNH